MNSEASEHSLSVKLSCTRLQSEEKSIHLERHESIVQNHQDQHIQGDQQLQETFTPHKSHEANQNHLLQEGDSLREEKLWADQTHCIALFESVASQDAPCLARLKVAQENCRIPVEPLIYKGGLSEQDIENDPYGLGFMESKWSRDSSPCQIREEEAIEANHPQLQTAVNNFLTEADALDSEQPLRTSIKMATPLKTPSRMKNRNPMAPAPAQKSHIGVGRQPKLIAASKQREHQRSNSTKEQNKPSMKGEIQPRKAPKTPTLSSSVNSRGQSISKGSVKQRLLHRGSELEHPSCHKSVPKLRAKPGQRDVGYPIPTRAQHTTRNKDSQSASMTKNGNRIYRKGSAATSAKTQERRNCLKAVCAQSVCSTIKQKVALKRNRLFSSADRVPITTYIKDITSGSCGQAELSSQSIPPFVVGAQKNPGFRHKARPSSAPQLSDPCRHPVHVPFIDKSTIIQETNNEAMGLPKVESDSLDLAAGIEDIKALATKYKGRRTFNTDFGAHTLLRPQLCKGNSPIKPSKTHLESRETEKALFTNFGQFDMANSPKVLKFDLLKRV